ncbi:uncharacterized protein LOC124667129 isoform X2 [Lolium rigidum]|uniref:uncharacterized protein LOC124667129 isoform X2 n=1 Tax=Lolium rigidum TaxID=89674 RepID=UPI001F5DE406|nr:uncharacterized protein LOC124667129 isoform X2 [Lolium rigidum]
MFDEMSGCLKSTTSCVLQVTVTHLIHPEEVLHQVFDVYGVTELCVLQRSTYLEVFVEFQSGLEAGQAQRALHGRCIYDGCCLLDIQHASPSISVITLDNSRPMVVDWDQVEVTPADVASVTCNLASSTPLTIHSGSAKESTPVVLEDASPMHHPAPDDRKQAPAKNELSSAVEVIDRTPERTRNGEMLRRFVKWVSRVRIGRRPVRWELRTKFRNSATMPSTPPVPPRPPDQPVYHLDICSPPRTPSPPDRPDQPPRIEFCSAHMVLECPIAHMPQFNLEQHMHGDIIISSKDTKLVGIKEMHISQPFVDACWIEGYGWRPPELLLANQCLPCCASTAFLFQNGSLENVHLTIRQWDPGILGILSKGFLSFIRKVPGCSLCAWRSYQLLALHLMGAHAQLSACALKIFGSQVVMRFSRENFDTATKNMLTRKHQDYVNWASMTHIKMVKSVQLLYFERKKICHDAFVPAGAELLPHERSPSPSAIRVAQLANHGVDYNIFQLIVTCGDVNVAQNMHFLTACRPIEEQNGLLHKLLGQNVILTEDKIHMTGPNKELNCGNSVIVSTTVRANASIEQITHVFVVLPKLLLPLQQPQGLYPFTIPELHDVPCVEVLEAHLQWYPGGF